MPNTRRVNKGTVVGTGISTNRRGKDLQKTRSEGRSNHNYNASPSRRECNTNSNDRSGCEGDARVMMDCPAAELYVDLAQRLLEREEGAPESIEEMCSEECVAREWGGWWNENHEHLLHHDDNDPQHAAQQDSRNGSSNPSRRLSGPAKRVAKHFLDVLQHDEEAPVIRVTAQLRHFPTTSGSDGVQSKLAASANDRLGVHQQDKENKLDGVRVKQLKPSNALRSTKASELKRKTVSELAGHTGRAISPSARPVSRAKGSDCATSKQVVLDFKRSRVHAQESEHLRACTQTRSSHLNISVKANATNDQKDLRELLASHNKKFKAIHTYEPSRHSVRDIRRWEKESGRTYYDLNPDERADVNSEILRTKAACNERE